VVVSWMFSSTLSAKLDLRSHPEAEELSVWLKRQSSGSNTPWKRSTQMFITQAMNLSEFIEDRRQQSTSNSNRQVTPEVMF